MNGPLGTAPEHVTLSEVQGEYRAAFDAAPLAMALLGGDGRIHTANAALARILGSEPDALIGTPAHALTGLDPGERRPATRPLPGPDGAPRWAEITVTPLRPDAGPDPGGTGALLTVVDVHERQELRERLRLLRSYDPVTRLPNRTLFFERLTGALAGSATGRIGLAYIDLDGFQAVNDSMGHTLGDRLLGAVARRLTRCAETTLAGPHLVARLGSDEFAVLVEESTGTDQLTALATAALTAVQRPFELDGQRLSVSASIGVVERPCAGTSAVDVARAADTTLSWAKDDGRARWALFDAERNAHRMARQSLRTRLRPAVERGEFTLEYQPIVGLADTCLRGVEALVRWDHPELGRLGPDRFIPLAEETGAIVPLGRWVLTEACRQAAQWQREHPQTPLYMSVNVAVRQCWDSDLVTEVEHALRTSGLPAGLLQLELTESAVMGTAGRPLQALQTLSDRGVRIAIDDFGTGYSNLAYLSRLPVRGLKLDGTFVRGFRTARQRNPADQTIVSSLVELAHKLGLSVTAECVEGAAQADRLRRIGCDAGQGWHYSRPLPADRVTALLAGQLTLGTTGPAAPGE